MRTLKRALAWLRKYNDLNLSKLPEELRKRVLKFRIMRGLVLIAASLWLFVPSLEILILGAAGVIALYILTSIIEPKLDKDLKKYITPTTEE